MPLQIIGYIASICVGLILGLLGGGGSILSIPILVYLFHLDIVMASAYSLFIVGTTSLVGVIPKYKDQLVNMKAGLLFGIPSVVSTFVTRKWIIHAIPDIIWQSGSLLVTKRLLLLGLFAALMILASVSMIRGRQQVMKDEEGTRTFLLIVEGVLIGFLNGLVGAGGGFLIIPALVFLTGLSFKTAAGTSLLIIAINSLSGFAGDLLNYQMNWPFLLTLTGLAITGILVGNKLSRNISAHKLRTGFGWFVLVMGSSILLRELIHASTMP